MPTNHVRIMRARESGMAPEDLKPKLVDLANALERGDRVEAKRLMQALVPEYCPDGTLELAAKV